MKAAVLHKVGEPLSIDDVPVPQIEADEVLVEVRTCGICRTDIHICDGLAYVPNLPHIPGHEPGGVAAKVGREVTGIKEGDHVVPHLFITCGRCNYCKAGQEPQCSDLKGLIGVADANGAFAEYYKAPARNLFVLPEKISFAAGGLVSCAVVTALHAFRRADLKAGDTAVIVGAGGVAQPLIQILKDAGVKVAATSLSAEALEIAAELGADLVFPAGGERIGERVRELSGRDGAHCVFNCVGTAGSMRESADCLVRGGKIVVIGEESEYPEIDTIRIAQEELSIIGSRNGSLKDMKDAIAMLAEGIITPPVARAFPLEQINEALDFVRSGRASARVVITIKES